MTMEKEKLEEIVANHGRWLQGEGGKRADLLGANLDGANLRGVNLEEANLHGASLRGAILRHAILRHANLCHTDLCHTDLRGAILWHANLYHANLCHTDLGKADLHGANLPQGVYQIMGPGSCNRCTTYDATNDQIICGCWDDDAGNHLDSFARRIEEIYGTKGETPNSKYYAEYMAAITFFMAMKELNKEVK